MARTTFLGLLLAVAAALVFWWAAPGDDASPEPGGEETHGAAPTLAPRPPTAPGTAPKSEEAAARARSASAAARRVARPTDQLKSLRAAYLALIARLHEANVHAEVSAPNDLSRFLFDVCREFPLDASRTEDVPS